MMLSAPSLAQSQGQSQGNGLSNLFGGIFSGPKPDAPAEIRGELGSIPTNVPGVRFGELLTYHRIRHADTRLHPDLFRVGSPAQTPSRRVGGILGRSDGPLELDALPAKYERLEKSNCRQDSGKFYKRPFGARFIFLLFSFAFAFFWLLWGWDNFYNQRRFFGAALISGEPPDR